MYPFYLKKETVYFDILKVFKLACTIIQGAIGVTLPSASALALASASYFKVLRDFFFFFMLWARHCQASYLVRGQVLFILIGTKVLGQEHQRKNC